MSLSSVATPLKDFYASESSRLRAMFEAAGDGIGLIHRRAALVDEVVSRLYHAFFVADSNAPRDFCLAAVGGYGRQELFPSSDIDLLFATSTERTLDTHREGIAALARNLWDLHMRVGHSARTIADCGQLHRADLEFSVSLLDLRYLAGDSEVFNSLAKAALHLMARDQQDLVRNLAEMTAQRHAKHGKTIFHLEPNVKEAPGGLRDYHVARWLSLIREMAERGQWVAAEDLWPRELRNQTAPSIQFLSAVRCFLHFQQGRDDNLLTYELQEKAAAAGLGMTYGKPANPAPWMRQYYLQARSMERLASRLIAEVAPSRSSLYSLFQDWRSRLSNADFSVVRGRIFPRSLASGDLSTLFSLFEMVARHALELSSEAERWVEERVRSLATGDRNLGYEGGLTCPAVWSSLRRILGLPNAAGALRVMHRLGFLTALFPEIRAIDGLVVRDFYHRYTVDEHSFMAIQSLAGLRRQTAEKEYDAGPAGAWERRFSELYSEIERPHLLCFALLFHDVGKGMDAPHHVAGSLEAAQKVCARLALDPADAEAVLFLIARHLEMSSTVSRRDIFDAETVGSFAGMVRTSERLKMLCLLTYADIKAVNPEALTPWRAEMLWQLYVMTSNTLSRSLDQDRLRVVEEGLIPANRILPLLEPATNPGELKAFLEGFPRRYLLTHSPQEIARHFLWARLIPQTAVHAKVERRAHFTELTVLTTDRPFVFASVTGVLAGWGMNILKADAFANRAGIVLDVFRFHDLFRALELNPSEAVRLEKNIVEVLTGLTSLQKVMAGRASPPKPARAKVNIQTQISFDEASSSHCTLLELITQDRPGLLYDVSSTLAALGSNIEVALIDTEAEKAIDVFYLTSQGVKLDRHQQEALRSALLKKL